MFYKTRLNMKRILTLTAVMLLLAACAVQKPAGIAYSETENVLHPGWVVTPVYSEIPAAKKGATAPDGERVILDEGGFVEIIDPSGIIHSSLNQLTTVELKTNKVSTVTLGERVYTCLLLEKDNVELHVNGNEISIKPVAAFNRPNYLVVTTIDKRHFLYKLLLNQ